MSHLSSNRVLCPQFCLQWSVWQWPNAPAGTYSWGTFKAVARVTAACTARWAGCCPTDSRWAWRGIAAPPVTQTKVLFWITLTSSPRIQRVILAGRLLSELHVALLVCLCSQCTPRCFGKAASLARRGICVKCVWGARGRLPPNAALTTTTSVTMATWGHYGTWWLTWTRAFRSTAAESISTNKKQFKFRFFCSAAQLM